MVGVQIVRKKNLIQKPENCGSHVVLLGAGASRAAFLNGDVFGKLMPDW